MTSYGVFREAVAELRIVGDAILGVLLAPRCLACDAALERPLSGPVCAACWAAIAFLTPPLCDACGAPLPSWRTVSHGHPVPAMPAAPRHCRSSCHRGSVRRQSAHPRPRAEVRRPPFAGATARSAHGRRRASPGRRIGLRDSCSAARDPATCTRLQPSRGPRRESREKRDPGPATRAPNHSSNGTVRGSKATEHAERLRDGTRARSAYPQPYGAAGRRRRDDGRDTEGMRARPESVGRAGGSSPYGCANRGTTAVATASDTSARGCSPSIRIQPSPAACRR